MLQAMTAPSTLLIVYHSHTGGTLQMVHALQQGAQQAAETLHVRLLHASDAHTKDVLQADAYVFATPENLAAISGLLKDFFDRTYYGALERIQGRPYATLICAGSDGSNAARQIARIATGWRLQAVVEPLIVCTHAQTPEAIAATKQIAEADLQACHDLGASLAAGLEMGIF